MWTVGISKAAQKDMRRLADQHRKQVAKVIDSLAEDPYAAGKKMRGEWAGFYRAWAGRDYRVVYTIDLQAESVTVTQVFPRGDAPYG